MAFLRPVFLRFSATSLCFRSSALFSSASNLDDEPRESFTTSIPVDKLTVSFSRSGGPGGQNVNKVNTKVELRFHVPSADWLPGWVKQKLINLEKNRISKLGELVVTSSVYRTQHQNLNDALSRLQTMVNEAGSLPNQPSAATVAKIKYLQRRAADMRLKAKKYQSQKKNDRKHSN
ncbi:large ribosomal subunit protein mL62-like [Corticium candelabrum]|uniref:large ribosomal subunit protein mL62-like n=1 Tax=Corticium candelabrum TaxID=121492 RepID=UPI002E3040CA|nr:large ribosomal subunit protein mL62-like [Corticium candelabrum]